MNDDARLKQVFSEKYKEREGGKKRYRYMVMMVTMKIGYYSFDTIELEMVNFAMDK